MCQTSFVDQRLLLSANLENLTQARGRAADQSLTSTAAEYRYTCCPPYFVELYKQPRLMENLDISAKARQAGLGAATPVRAVLPRRFRVTHLQRNECFNCP